MKSRAGFYTTLLTARKLCSATLSKHEFDRSENFIWKRIFAFLPSFFNYSKSLCLKKKWVLTILELNWNQRLGHKKTKLNICHDMLTSSTQLQNRSFHVVERTRTSSKFQKNVKNARAKRAKILFFIVKYANLWGFCCRRRRGCLRTFAPKSSYGEIFFISPLELVHKVLSPKMKKKMGVTDFVSEKMAVEKCLNFDKSVIITRCSLLY